jgi:hypothetical protein
MLPCVLGHPLVPAGPVDAARTNLCCRSRVTVLLVPHKAETRVNDGNYESHMCKQSRVT